MEILQIAATKGISLIREGGFESKNFNFRSCSPLDTYKYQSGFFYVWAVKDSFVLSLLAELDYFLLFVSLIWKVKV